MFTATQLLRVCLGYWVLQEPHLNMILLLRVNQATFLRETQKLRPHVHTIRASTFIHPVILANEHHDAIQLLFSCKLCRHVRHPCHHRLWEVCISVDAGRDSHNTCEEVHVVECANHSPYCSHAETHKVDAVHVDISTMLGGPFLQHWDDGITKDIQLLGVIVELRLRTQLEVGELVLCVRCGELGASLRERLRLKLWAKDD
mmetsp:Transcript_44895/g.81931  ORF Transcript_44895/g.81931 Transcript_44895/m.81931 type:complete len:202 (+) Transcript_44895:214-819(+)